MRSKYDKQQKSQFLDERDNDPYYMQKQSRAQNMSPGLQSTSRFSNKYSPNHGKFKPKCISNFIGLSNRSSTSSKPYSFRIGNLNKNSRLLMTTPKRGVRFNNSFH